MANDLKFASFNCNGLKGSMAYVKHLVDSNTISFLCEHWLRPDELTTMKKYFGDSWCHLISSMDPLKQIRGRPYGGLGFICKKLQKVSYQEVQCDFDKIIGMKIIVNQITILTVFGLYLPYDDHSNEQLELYIETIDRLHDLMDNTNSPVIVLGDMNTVLPQSTMLSYNWYRKKPFSGRSAILYDFICDQELCIANFNEEQKVNYTFQRGRSKSYIDYILVPQYLVNSVKKCVILDDACENVSDHLALAMTITISLEETSQSNGLSEKSKICQQNWDNPTFVKRYSQVVGQHVSNIRLLDPSKIAREDAECVLNDLSTSVSNAMQKAAQECAELMSVKP